ncbi:MAG: hypothetical protein QN141_10760 [Armatimonadota bacterium]|nr:hypothetical protein [Armatimonadota bacterium]MDR7451472.1 hypothetical protein [Armatimonadota bacterium]MDR7467439.1 hypothetical protein [Armatimonadota bacterium]MDR7494313.1 hypothetical protein [Armatimonadota bacterium]MDR7504857.1 hypothetical protein [Armatimonadota bacterium]
MSRAGVGRVVAAAALVAALALALQARPLSPPTTAEARDWYFQSHARLSEIHRKRR